MTDVDYDRFIAWARARTVTVVPDTRTAGQVLIDFVQSEWQAWKDAVQTFERLPASNPNSPIGIA
jgi:hypothetical protein